MTRMEPSATPARCQRKQPSHCSVQSACNWPFIQWSWYAASHRIDSHFFCLVVFLYLQAEGEDNLKKMQLMELAILNGTYRDNNIKARK